MGRIDEAFRRSNVDAGAIAGAPQAVPQPSAWSSEAPPANATPVGVPTPPGHPPAASAFACGEAPGGDVPWGGFDESVAERLVVSSSAPPRLLEEFGSLAAILQQAQGTQPLKSVMVTSASPGEGKTWVAVNLALTLSDSYWRRVLLIDAHLRQPALHELFRVSNAGGLSEALRLSSTCALPVLQLTKTLALLPAGRSDRDPLELLSSGQMTRVMADATSRFDWVLVDSPPVGQLADARLASGTVDAAIFVIRAGVTRFPDVDAAVEAIGRERILGVVLNAAEPAEPWHGGY